MKKLNVIKLQRLDRALITCELMTINDDIEDFHREINCRTIDIVSRVFGGVRFDVICDDEGLLKAGDSLPTSWWQGEGYTPNHEGLFGTLLLCHSDSEGNLTSALDKEIINVALCQQDFMDKNGQPVTMLFHEI